MPTESFRLLNEFIGWGNPHANYWFVGIEEGGDPWPDSDESRATIARDYSSSAGYQSLTPENIREALRCRTKIYNYMSSILFRGETHPTVENHLEYRNDVLANRIFRLNRYPLAKRRKSDPLPDHYRKLFGFGPDEEKQYHQEVVRTRFPLLRKFWLQYSPPITVCFGKGYVPNDVQRIFNAADLDPSIRIQLHRIGNVSVFETPFFGLAGRGQILSYKELEPVVTEAKRLQASGQFRILT